MTGDASNPFAPPEPMARPTWGAPPTVGTGPGWTGAPLGFTPVATPASALRTAASRARTAAVLSWVLVGGWTMVLVGGLVHIAAGAQEADGDVVQAVETNDVAFGLVGMGTLIYLVCGIAMWALLALWASHTARSARMAGNCATSRSGMAWWGQFVPVANFVLPLLAYVEAAKYANAVASVDGEVIGRGDGWRRGPMPTALLTWWLLYIPAAVAIVVHGTFGEESYDANGAAALVAGIFGISSAVCGALALRSVAASILSRAA